MVAARRAARRAAMPVPPPRQANPIIHGSTIISHWLTYYWQKLELPAQELSLLAITQDRQEYMRWTGKRLNILALGCYCYCRHRHLIFIEPDMQPQSIEVTVAHELIHLADHVKGTPRRHRHHGYDSIAADEAAVTGYDLDELRRLLHEESARREGQRRERRPIRHLYECPNCGKEYPRARRYSQAVSCSKCDSRYNPQFRLVLRNKG